MTMNEIKKLYLSVLEDSIPLLTYCRDLSLQKEMINKLKEHVIVFKNFKWQANHNKQEKNANYFFGCHNYLNAIKSCIESIVALKENNPHVAWDKLIDAEEYYSWASKIEECLLNEFSLDAFTKKMEDVLFPHFKVFSSLGFKTTKGDCSVCLKKIDECEHIEGRIYSGIACFEINKKLIEIDHSAIVENPKDRRCVPTEISENGKMIDYFTLKEVRELNDNENDECAKGSLLANWAVMNFQDTEIN